MSFLIDFLCGFGNTKIHRVLWVEYEGLCICGKFRNKIHRMIVHTIKQGRNTKRRINNLLKLIIRRNTLIQRPSQFQSNFNSPLP